MMSRVLMTSIFASSLLLAQSDSHKELMIDDGELEIEYSRVYDENIIDFKYGLTKDIELIPVGFRYRFLHDNTNQLLVQLNLIGYSGTSSSSSWENDGMTETQSYSNHTIDVLGKLIYKLTPSDERFSTQLEYSYMYQINDDSQYGSKNGNVHQISIEQFYYFYQEYAIGLKGSYLDGSMFTNGFSGYIEDTYYQKMVRLSLYLPISEDFDVVGSYQKIFGDSERVLNPITYNEPDRQDEEYLGIQVLYRFDPSELISYFRW